jgi:putative transposase
VSAYGLSIRRACHIARLSRAAFYRPHPLPLARDAAVIDALQALVERHPQSGFWKCYRRLRRQGHAWNHKRVHRVYCALRLNLPRRTKRRVPTRLRQPLVAPTALNRIWALDFMADALYGGRKFRTLNVLDEGNREALAIEVACAIPSGRVVRVLDDLVSLHGAPAALRMDNGPELTSEALRAWCEQHGIEQRFIQPGKPDQNAFIERFNRSYRQDVLNAYVFGSLAEVARVTEEWRHDYNTERPHDSLDRQPPCTYLSREIMPSESSYEVSR